jgi:predicted RNase H-like HicB family nuclease
MKLLVVVENGDTNLSAYVPDLPGCVSTGATREYVLCNIREAMALHLAGMLEDGEMLPEPVESWAESVEINPADIERARVALQVP